MKISIIICTIRRASLMDTLLGQLHAQTHRDAEILIVGGQDTSRAGEYLGLRPENGLPMSYHTAPKGLAPARNVGLRHAQGDVVCFLDDDVFIKLDFLERITRVLAQPDMEKTGGLTAFDDANVTSPGARWHFRHWMRITPTLEPGSSTHLGRSIPFSFFQPFTGCRFVQWLPGFCQIFRRAAIEGMEYDEEIVVEDRDFSMRVGDRWRLAICGDIHMEHRPDPEARHSTVKQIKRASYGLGRSFRKRQRNLRDKLSAYHVLTGEFLLDVGVALLRPTLANWQIPGARASAFLAGYRYLPKP